MRYLKKTRLALIPCILHLDRYSCKFKRNLKISYIVYIMDF